MHLPQRLLAGFLFSAALTSGAAPVAAQSCANLSAGGGALNGVYRTATGVLISVLPADKPDQLRVVHFQAGHADVLLPVGSLVYRANSNPALGTPTTRTYAFKAEQAGTAARLMITARGRPPQVATRMALQERDTTIQSGDVQLAARLTLPANGRGPFKTVIYVHGSDPIPSVGREWLPHLLAARGVATLVFDKRGTGCSTGRYVQHFDVLSDDVVAAARWLRTQPEVRADAIGLAGFSQGGWVAPLAATKEPAIRFVAVAYGLAMSLADEDRLEAPLKLRARGLSDADLQEFETLNASLHRVARAGFKDWTELEQQLSAFKDRKWLSIAAQEQSWVGVLLQMGLPQAKIAAPGMFKDFFQPFYEPVPTLESLNIPMLWLIAGKDIEAPPELTLVALDRLQRQGKPLTVRVFPNADHGMQDFIVIDGRRAPTGYAKGYFASLAAWIDAQR